MPLRLKKFWMSSNPENKFDPCPGKGEKKEKFFFSFLFPFSARKSRLRFFSFFSVFQRSRGEIGFFFFVTCSCTQGCRRFFFCSLSFSPSVLEGGRYVYSIKGKRKKGMSRRIFFCPSAESFFPSPQEGSGRRGEGKKRKGKQIKKTPP